MIPHSELEGENVGLAGLVKLLANLWGGLQRLSCRWDRSYRLVLGMSEQG